jgi:hypothetical protein
MKSGFRTHFVHISRTFRTPFVLHVCERCVKTECNVFKKGKIYSSQFPGFYWWFSGEITINSEYYLSYVGNGDDKLSDINKFPFTSKTISNKINFLQKNISV